MWRKFICPLCYAGSNKLSTSLGDWTATIKASQRLWPFYYSCETNMLYRGYRKHWHDFEGYQSNIYKNEVFYFTPEDRNIDLQYILDDMVSVDIAVASQGWRVCHHQSLRLGTVDVLLIKKLYSLQNHNQHTSPSITKISRATSQISKYTTS